MMDVIIFVLVVIIIAALIARIYTVRQKKERLIFSLYLNMFELYGYYYWLIISGKKQKPALEEKIKTLVWMVMTDMNKIKKLPFAHKLEDLLLCDLSKNNTNAAECYHHLGEMLQLFEEYISKKHRRVLERISSHKFKAEEKMPGDAKRRGELFNAPGFIDWKPTQRR